jgi:flagellar biosynthesis/type III secretory pathway ATPase
VAKFFGEKTSLDKKSEMVIRHQSTLVVVASFLHSDSLRYSCGDVAVRSIQMEEEEKEITLKLLIDSVARFADNLKTLTFCVVPSQLSSNNIAKKTKADQLLCT